MMQVPELNFVTADVEQTQAECLKLMEEYLGYPLERANPLRLLLNSLLAIIIQQRLMINEVAKMNLLAFSKGEYLDRLGDLVGVERLPAAAAVTTVEVKLSSAREQTTIIKKGTRVTSDDTIYFALDKALIFAPGETSKTCAATCTTVGEVGDNFLPGEINKIVDPQPYLASIVNTTKSEGGADIESDDSLRDRIHEAPESFSNAGSEGAYKWHAKSASALISDVQVDSSEPGKVEVYVLMKGGVLPEQEMLEVVNSHLNAKTIRPLTDQVSVHAPAVVEYEIDMEYWIREENQVQAEQIIEDVQSAVDDYVAWQSARIGRDIITNELSRRMLAIGVKRVLIHRPVFTAIEKHSVAKCTNIDVRFAGFEDD